ncbi:AraC family transcriptional regulator [Litoreibacter sp.]|nr:AraC family transcriptional regulator [Litoreibacter sp.]
MADVISYLLDMIRVRGTAFIGKNLNAPWCMSVEEHSNLARFHLVLAGEAWLELPQTGKRERLGKGDFVIVPNGRPHVLSDEIGRKKTTNDLIPNVDIEPNFQTFDRNSEATHLLCGYFQISGRTPPTILSRFPDVFIERKGRASQELKTNLILQIVELELSKQAAPTPIILNRLTEALCIYVIHRWLARTLVEDIQISALADPRLHLVLDEIHADPAGHWTVENLARLYGQSRTAFALQFKAAMGLSPIHYVTNTRVRLARKMLEESNLPLDDVAGRTGYADTNAFNRAFKRETGTAPATFRRMSRK